MNEFENVRRAVYKLDVSADASLGKIGTHKLGVLPANSVITQCWRQVQTTYTSATDAATIALGITGTVGYFRSALAISAGGNVWDAGVPIVTAVATDGAVANFTQPSATSVNVIATVAVEDVTAGVGYLVVEYYVKD